MSDNRENAHKAENTKEMVYNKMEMFQRDAWQTPRGQLEKSCQLELISCVRVITLAKLFIWPMCLYQPHYHFYSKQH